MKKWKKRKKKKKNRWKKLLWLLFIFIFWQNELTLRIVVYRSVSYHYSKTKKLQRTKQFLDQLTTSYQHTKR